MVVGAGIVGCAIAYELARRGASVEIVDDRPAGMGATQASAGMLAPFIEARDGGPLLDLTARSLDLFDTFVARAAADSGSTDQLPAHRHARRRASPPTSMRELTERHALLADRGVDPQLLDAPSRAGPRTRSVRRRRSAAC